MSLFVTLLLSISAPILYGVIGIAVGICMFCLITAREKRDKDRVRLSSDAGFAGFLSGAFWPVGLWALAALYVIERGGLGQDESQFSRRQQRELAFERERAEWAERALKAQREWMQLVEKDEVAP